MIKSALLSLLIAITFTQNPNFPCTGQNLTEVNGAAGFTFNHNVSITYGYNVVSCKWKNPMANTSAIIDIYGWDTNQTFLYEIVLNPENTSQVSARVGYNESGILFSPINDTGKYIFAFKGTSVLRSSIEVISQQTVNGTIGFSFSLFKGGYNNFKNNTCEKECSGLIDFVKVNGTTYPTEFACSSYEESWIGKMVNTVLEYF